MRMMIAFTALTLLAGCASIPGGMLAQSRISISTDVVKVDGTKEKTKVKAQGEAAQTVNIERQGEAYSPDAVQDGHGNVWPDSPSMLSVNSDHSVQTPWAMEVASGLRVALEQTPETVGQLMQGITAINSLPDSAVPVPNFREMLIRGLVERFLGRFAGDDAPDLDLSSLLP